ncbi:697_t:CDS:2 [Funneliformis caledonium]|uniref:697_t:CDS:1 n=1 Tax=Funneliformis caledonium TaxID=1117310 RepID=A0A9N9GCP1_9GLOM|nr:697_t:CDS:2 [Funneliformis caledonium]
MAANTTSDNYVALFQDYSHICTCLLLFSEGLSRWYKKDVDLNKIDALDDSFSHIGNESSTTVIRIWQIYGEYAALGRKLASLASEFHVTHIAATLRGLIQEVELSNTNNSINNQDEEIILNPLQVNTKGRPNKRLKSFGEKGSKDSTSKSTSRSGDG